MILKYNQKGAFSSAIEIMDQDGFIRLGTFVKTHDGFTFVHQRTGIDIIDVISKSPVNGTVIERDLYFDPTSVEITVPDEYQQKTSVIGEFRFPSQPELWPSIRLVEIGNPVRIPGFEQNTKKCLLYVGGRMTPITGIDIIKKPNGITIMSKPRNTNAGNLHTKPQTLIQEVSPFIKAAKPEAQQLRQQYFEQLVKQLFEQR